ncbi:hypothetical protein [Phaeocystidibacter marisrubri]|uniref:Uncharacterized protein n=1 Tax=Phaeocystidibacter marisrubri TaxID=1577780 RepID=A0A6L3ZDT8_9FLAO|nr:hypothetical protein [Phaeocystidibacter marisrubri]KAB2816005.1 hypothetical protein F8C82_09935 [Phaeocystidibacter marisrubri]
MNSRDLKLVTRQVGLSCIAFILFAVYVGYAAFHGLIYCFTFYNVSLSFFLFSAIPYYVYQYKARSTNTLLILLPFLTFGLFVTSLSLYMGGAFLFTAGIIGYHCLGMSPENLAQHNLNHPFRFMINSRKRSPRSLILCLFALYASLCAVVLFLV